MTRRPLLVLVALGLVVPSCADGPTTLRLTIDADRPLGRLELFLMPDGGQPARYLLPADGTPPVLPGVFVVDLTDRGGRLFLRATGTALDGQALDVATTLEVEPGRANLVSLRLRLPRLPASGVCAKGEDCESGHCVQGLCCDRACDGPCETCTDEDGPAGTCHPRATGTLCRPVAGACDREDRCDGQGGTCPDAVAAADTVCRAAVGACDLVETCDGTSADCPADGSSCPDTAYCTAAGCQPRRATGNPCTAPTECTSGFCATGYCCDRACTGACETCALATADPGTCRPAPSGTVCRGSTGACDPQETCSGNAPDCPPDAKLTPQTATYAVVDDGFTNGTVFNTQQHLRAGCISGSLYRIFLTFGTSALPDTAQITSASLAGCSLGGNVAGGAHLYTTSYPRPFSETAFGSLTTGDVTTMLEAAGTEWKSQLLPNPASLISPTSDRQFSIRQTNESCGPDRVHTWDASFINVVSCTGYPAGFRLSVAYCAP